MITVCMMTSPSCSHGQMSSWWCSKYSVCFSWHISWIARQGQVYLLVWDKIYKFVKIGHYNKTHLQSLSTQSHLTTCYASRHYAGRVISVEGIGLQCLIIRVCMLVWERDKSSLPETKRSDWFVLWLIGFVLSMLYLYLGLNIFYLSQDVIKDQAERKAMFSPLLYLALQR